MWLFPLPMWKERRMLSKRNVCGKNLGSQTLWLHERLGLPPCHQALKAQELLPMTFPRVQEAGWAY